MSSVASKTSYLTHCTFNSCIRHLKLLSYRKGGLPHLHSGVLTFFCLFLLLSIFSPLKGADTPPPTPWKWLVVVPSCSIFLTYKTFRLLFSLTVIKQPEEKNVPQHTVVNRSSVTNSHPIINILSAHAHGKGLGATQKVRYQCMSPGNPKHHAPRLPCRFLRDLLALKRPSRKRSWRQLGRVQNGMLWLEHASLLSRLFNLEAA